MRMVSTAAPGGTAAPAPPYAGASDGPGVPWWGVLSALAAPLLLVAGWTAAAALQPRSFNAIAETVSALAAVGAAGRWVMTLAFAAAGACEVVTGLALRPAAAPGRLILMAAAWPACSSRPIPSTPGARWRTRAGPGSASRPW